MKGEEARPLRPRLSWFRWGPAPTGGLQVTLPSRLAASRIWNQSAGAASEGETVAGGLEPGTTPPVQAVSVKRATRANRTGFHTHVMLLEKGDRLRQRDCAGEARRFRVLANLYTQVTRRISAP